MLALGGITDVSILHHHEENVLALRLRSRNAARHGRVAEVLRKRVEQRPAHADVDPGPARSNALSHRTPRALLNSRLQPELDCALGPGDSPAPPRRRITAEAPKMVAAHIEPCAQLLWTTPRSIRRLGRQRWQAQLHEALLDESIVFAAHSPNT